MADSQESPRPQSDRPAGRPGSYRRLILNFVIELLVYGLLVLAYFLIALRWLATPLVGLFQDRLTVYGVVSLALIVFQGVALEAITAFLVRQLGLERLE